jgi:CRISPR-associated protein Cmr2
MGRSLALARRAEKLAKRTRDALAVLVDKRSGPPLSTRGAWSTVDRDLKQYVQFHLCDWVPDGAAHELQALARLLPDPKAPETDEAIQLTQLVRREAERILRRKQPQHGDQAALAEATLKSLLAALDEKPDDGKLGIELLAERLLIAKVIAEAALESQAPAAGEPT